jgi:cytochrome b
LVRLFHWSLVAAFVVAYVTGDGRDLHEQAGYAVAALIAFRVVWGVIGPKHARFADFVRPPRAVASHLAALLRGRPERCLGHNPAGGAMILALLILLSLDSLTGYLMTTDAFFGSAFMEAAHEIMVDITLAFIGLHILGVIASSILEKENLVAAMITGRKRAAQAEPGEGGE